MSAEEAEQHYQLAVRLFCSPTSSDKRRSVAHFRAAAKLGHYMACLCMGDILLKGQAGQEANAVQSASFYQQALPSLVAAAEAGDAKAQYFLGLSYWNGRGVGRDWHQAAFWLAKAAQQGSAEAQFRMGMCYHNGQGGVERDRAAAIDMFRRAAASGFGMACYQMAQLCLEDNDVAESNRYFRMALAKNVPDALFAYAGHLRQLGGKELQVAELLAWAAGQGHRPSIAALSSCANSSDLRVLYTLGTSPTAGQELALLNARRVYIESSERARQAALCWICGGLLLPHKPLMLRIAQDVYNSRKNPAVWGVSATTVFSSVASALTTLSMTLRRTFTW